MSSGGFYDSNKINSPRKRNISHYFSERSAPKTLASRANYSSFSSSRSIRINHKIIFSSRSPFKNRLKIYVEKYLIWYKIMVWRSAPILTRWENMMQNFFYLIFFLSGHAFEFPINYDEQANGLLGNQWVQKFSTVLNYEPPDLYRKHFRPLYFDE